MSRGYESVYGHYTGGIGDWVHVHSGGLYWHRDGKALEEEGYVMHLQGRGMGASYKGGLLVPSLFLGRTLL